MIESDVDREKQFPTQLSSPFSPTCNLYYSSAITSSFTFVRVFGLFSDFIPVICSTSRELPANCVFKIQRGCKEKNRATKNVAITTEARGYRVLVIPG